jgi:hypothetical protein
MILRQEREAISEACCEDNLGEPGEDLRKNVKQCQGDLRGRERKRAYSPICEFYTTRADSI